MRFLVTTLDRYSSIISACRGGPTRFTEPLSVVFPLMISVSLILPCLAPRETGRGGARSPRAARSRSSTSARRRTCGATSASTAPGEVKISPLEHKPSQQARGQRLQSRLVVLLSRRRRAAPAAAPSPILPRRGLRGIAGLRAGGGGG